MKRPLGRFLRSVGKGIIDSMPILSSIRDNVKSAHKTADGTIEGIATKETYAAAGVGKIDWVRLVTCIAGVGIIVAFLIGKIAPDQLTTLLDLIFGPK